jgi:hypothetical protein
MIALNSQLSRCAERRMVTDEVLLQKSAAGDSREDISAAWSPDVQMRRIHTEKSEHTPRGFRLSGFFHLTALVAVLVFAVAKVDSASCRA